MKPDTTATTHARNDADAMCAQTCDEANALLVRVRTAVEGLLVELASLEREMHARDRVPE